MSIRLDVALTERSLSESRSRAQAWIKDGLVSVNGKTVTKPSFPTEPDDEIAVRSEEVCPYVSRGGLKLAAALSAFSVTVEGKICADIGASTGGFTDCLLQNGAAHVFAIDAGSDQLHHVLRSDRRVTVIEHCNARYLTLKDLPTKVSLMTMDVSFISQTKLFSALTPFLTDGAVLLTLIKPQFEVGPHALGKGGVVKDPKAREQAIRSVTEEAGRHGLRPVGRIDSPITGGDGNHEYMACFVYQPENTKKEDAQ